MSIVYFSEKALENIASREKLDNSEKACYDLALRKDCCKRIYFPKSKSSYHDHLLDTLQSNLQGRMDE